MVMNTFLKKRGFTPYHFSEKSGKGFTLIEILVVVAIIGMLSAIILASLSASHARGRDAKRVSDLNQLRLALQLYYDANQNYPPGNGTVASKLGTLSNSNNNYISVLPTDPGGGSAAYEYMATPSGCDNSSTMCSGYILAAQMESDPTSLNGYNTSATPTFDINGSTGNAHNCTQNASPNFIYCVRP